MAIIGNNTVEASIVDVNNAFQPYMNTSATLGVYTAVSGDAVTQMHLYARNGANGTETIQIGVYDITSVTGQANGAVLIGSVTIDPTVNTAQWWDSDAVNWALTAGHIYAVAFAAPTDNIDLYRSTSVGSYSFETAGVQNLASGADPWGEAATHISNGNNRRYSLYATVTNSGGGGTTKANLIKQVSRYHLGVGSLGRIQRRS